jgi:hypothetical protein
MKVYAIPDELKPIPELDLKETTEAYFARIDAHKQNLVARVKQNGCSEAAHR